MTENQLVELVGKIKKIKTETRNIELKKAKTGCPEALYDTLSSFSNTNGGIIIFGIDEKHGFKAEGVDDVSNLQKHVTEQCLEMEPEVRPLFSIATIEEKTICSIEIPEIDSILKPCFYKGKGKFKGSYIRIGEADLPMDEYEIYSFDAFKYKTEDELRDKDRIKSKDLNQYLIDGFVSKIVSKKPNLMNQSKDDILKLNGIINNDGNPTLCGMLNFGIFPQLFSPNLDILAVRCATNTYGEEDKDGIRFIDNKRIDGTIEEMVKQALAFIQNNSRKSTYVDSKTAMRNDKEEYPIKALREIILNAIIHRDYSIYTENEPIRIDMYDNRIEISNPGGLYGRLRIDELGKTRADIRNPFIASILEIQEISENRYSGIPTIYKEMEKAHLLPPLFENYRGTFKVTLFNQGQSDGDKLIEEIMEYCHEPRSKETVAKHFGFDEKHPAYFINNYVRPLINKGVLRYTIPDKPKSKNQRIVSTNSRY